MNVKTIAIKVNDEIIAKFKVDEEMFEKYVGRKPLNDDELGKLIEVAKKNIKMSLSIVESKVFEGADMFFVNPDTPFIIENVAYQYFDDYHISLNGKVYYYDYDNFMCRSKGSKVVSAICRIYKNGRHLRRQCLGIFSDIEAARRELEGFSEKRHSAKA